MTKFHLKKYLAGLLVTALTFTSVPVYAQAETDKDPVILYTNDVHCAIDGYSAFAAYAAQLEAEGHEVIIVDAGDAIQGEVIGTLTEGDAIVDLMNTVGYDYAVPGNHEFDYGMDTFLNIANSEETKFEYLSSNFVDLKTGETVFEPYDIVEVGGEEIAFVGITTPETYTKSTPTYFQDEEGNIIYGFSQTKSEDTGTYDELYGVVQDAVDAAREEGADRVIAVGHLGIEETTEGWKSTDVIANTTGIDVFIDAHSHEVISGDVYENKDGDDVLLSSTGTKFANFGKLTLDDDNVEITELISMETLEVDKNSDAYKNVQSKIDEYNAEVEYLYEKIGTSEADLVAEDENGNRIIRAQETNMGDFVTDAYKAITGADIAILNSGGIRANVDKGDVSRKALMDVNPWNNEISVVKATGQQILDALEHGARLHPELNGGFLQVSGLTYEIHNYIESPVVTDETGSFLKVDDTKERRVSNVKVNGTAIDPEAEYTVASITYLLKSGGDGFTMFKDCEVVKREGLPCDSEMLIQYLKENLAGVISSEQYGNKNGSGRIKIVASEEEVYNYLKVAGISVNGANADDILGDGTVSFDLETNTLTLENANIAMDKASKNYAVYAKGDLNIVLKGKNKLSSDYLYGIAIVDPANKDSISVNISGDGSLDSYGSDGGIFVKGSLKIDGDVSVAGRCGEDVLGNAYGIRVNNDFEICGNSKVTAKAGSATGNSYGIYAGDNFTACGDATVNTEGGKGVERSAGLYAISNIYVKDNATVTALGAVNDEPEKFASESYGIRTTHMYISGGTVTTTGQGATGSGLSAGIYTQDFELSGGTVNANSVDATDALSIGIQSTKTLKIMGGTLKATSGDTTSDSYAIEASGAIDVSGGVVYAVTGQAENSYGIDADRVNISGGTVNVSNKGTLSQARGIRSRNEINISDANVQVDIENAKNRVYGIQAGAPVTITGGKVFVNTGSAAKGAAIYGWGDITIADGEVWITSKCDGIYAPGGSVNINCSDVTVDKNRPLLLGTRVTVDANGYTVYGQKGISISDNLTIETPENGIITQVQTENGETYSYISSEDGTVSESVEIVPLGYYVTIKGLENTLAALVPAGKSVNEALAPNWGVEDFTEAMDTTKEGYTFEGFYTDENFAEGTEYSFDTVVTEDITIYAKWMQNKDESTSTENADDADHNGDVEGKKEANDSKVVQTGDNAKAGILAAVCIAMLILIVIMVLRRRKF